MNAQTMVLFAGKFFTLEESEIIFKESAFTNGLVKRVNVEMPNGISFDHVNRVDGQSLKVTVI